MEQEKEIVRRRVESYPADGESRVVRERVRVSEAEERRKDLFQAWHVVYYIFGFIEILLLFRFVFKLLGANPASGFVAFIYTVTGMLVAPFARIFPIILTLEPATLVAMVVYWVLAWGIARLVEIQAIR